MLNVFINVNKILSLVEFSHIISVRFLWV